MLDSGPLGRHFIAGRRTRVAGAVLGALCALAATLMVDSTWLVATYHLRSVDHPRLLASSKASADSTPLDGLSIGESDGYSYSVIWLAATPGSRLIGPLANVLPGRPRVGTAFASPGLVERTRRLGFAGSTGFELESTNPAVSWETLLANPDERLLIATTPSGAGGRHSDSDGRVYLTTAAGPAASESARMRTGDGLGRPSPFLPAVEMTQPTSWEDFWVVAVVGVVPLLAASSLVALQQVAQRSRRRATLRRLGASADQVASIAAFQTALVALPGVGAVTIASGLRSWISNRTGVGGVSFFPRSFSTSVALAAASATLALLLACGVVGVLDGAVERLAGRSRKGTPVRLRGAVTIAGGFGLLAHYWVSRSHPPLWFYASVLLISAGVPMLARQLVGAIRGLIPSSSLRAEVVRGRLSTSTAHYGRAAGMIGAAVLVGTVLLGLVAVGSAPHRKPDLVTEVRWRGSGLTPLDDLSSISGGEVVAVPALDLGGRRYFVIEHCERFRMATRAPLTCRSSGWQDVAARWLQAHYGAGTVIDDVGMALQPGRTLERVRVLLVGGTSDQRHELGVTLLATRFGIGSVTPSGAGTPGSYPHLVWLPEVGIVSMLAVIAALGLWVATHDGNDRSDAALVRAGADRRTLRWIHVVCLLTTMGVGTVLGSVLGGLLRDAGVSGSISAPIVLRDVIGMGLALVGMGGAMGVLAMVRADRIDTRVTDARV